MKARAAFALALGLAVACASDNDATGVKIIKGGGEGGFSLSGAIYGFTGGPDSQQVALSGVVVSVVRLADIGPDTGIVNPDTGVTNPDTSVTPPVMPDSIACPVEMLCARPAGGRTAFVFDTVPTPPTSCFDNGDVMTATTDAAGSFTLEGLTDGRYGLKVQPASGSGFSGFSYCGGILLTENRPDPLNFYLAPTP